MIINAQLSKTRAITNSSKTLSCLQKSLISHLLALKELIDQSIGRNSKLKFKQLFTPNNIREMTMYTCQLLDVVNNWMYTKSIVAKNFHMFTFYVLSHANFHMFTFCVLCFVLHASEHVKSRDKTFYLEMLHVLLGNCSCMKNVICDCQHLQEMTSGLLL